LLPDGMSVPRCIHYAAIADTSLSVTCTVWPHLT